MNVCIHIYVYVSTCMCVCVHVYVCACVSNVCGHTHVNLVSCLYVDCIFLSLSVSFFIYFIILLIRCMSITFLMQFHMLKGVCCHISLC